MRLDSTDRFEPGLSSPNKKASLHQGGFFSKNGALLLTFQLAHCKDHRCDQYDGGDDSNQNEQFVHLVAFLREGFVILADSLGPFFKVIQFDPSLRKSHCFHRD